LDQDPRRIDLMLIQQGDGPPCAVFTCEGNTKTAEMKTVLWELK